MNWREIFESASPYDSFLEKYAAPGQRARWDQNFARVSLSDEATELLKGFSRRMPVLCMAGAWCGDCAGHCPILQKIALGSAAIELRFIDRDANASLGEELSINGGRRVPVVVFLSEDFYELARFGDKTLSIYRKHAAARAEGAACSSGLVPPSPAEIAVVVREWLDQFERAQLMLRLSSRLREKYGD